MEALRKREETERQREEELQAQGDQEVAKLKAIIDEENALVQDKILKQTAPKVREKEALMTPEASDSESDNGGGIAMLDLEDDLPQASGKHRNASDARQSGAAKVERMVGTDNSTKATQPGDLAYLAPESEPDLYRTSEMSMYSMQSSEHTELVLLWTVLLPSVAWQRQ